ncbi:unnamed protein product [Cylicocyclus nassatus]|uniref:DOMON domain-containing protein n=1 Tax=Cylicocyclus nassatus TaxID=53992 RepID=A0AA36GLE2_CYLNA|nr:unnamed protein product [Cylicocyclus nassatus]
MHVKTSQSHWMIAFAVFALLPVLILARYDKCHPRNKLNRTWNKAVEYGFQTVLRMMRLDTVLKRSCRYVRRAMRCAYQAYLYTHDHPNHNYSHVDRRRSCVVVKLSIDTPLVKIVHKAVKKNMMSLIMAKSLYGCSLYTRDRFRIRRLMFRALVALSFVANAVSQCHYNGTDISARWQVVDDKITIEFVNKNIGDNVWTGLAFGPNMTDLEVVLVKIQNNKPELVTGQTTGWEAPTLDNAANVSPQLLSFNSNQLTFRFARPLGDHGARGHNLEQCQKWSFVRSSPLGSNGQVRKHSYTPISTVVCPRQCVQVFDTRDVIANPVPQLAIYNNRQSSRFDGLHGYYRV